MDVECTIPNAGVITGRREHAVDSCNTRLIEIGETTRRRTDRHHTRDEQADQVIGVYMCYTKEYREFANFVSALAIL